LVPEKYAAGASTGELEREWWRSFREPELSVLIELGLRDNPGLRAAAQRVLAARCEAASLDARGEPVIGARAGFTRQGNSQEKAFRMPTPMNTWSGAFDFSWDLDLWGAALRIEQDAAARAGGSAADEAAARHALVAEIGRLYFDQRSAAVELAETEIDLGREKELIALAQSRFDAGLNDESGLLDARRRLAALEGEAATLRLRLAQARHALMQLCATTELPPLQLANLDGEIPVFPAGVPASLLRRRPDVLAAEARLRSALAQQGVAEAELYPQFSLTGSLGREAMNFGDLKKSSADVWSLGPSLRWQLFNRSSLHRRVDAAGARARAAEADWEETWRRALREVEDALVAVEEQRRRRLAAESDAAAALSRVRRETARQASGLSDPSPALRLAQEHGAALRRLEASRRDQAQASIALAKALGGGWKAE
jgi:NodT family efflux transporter outer membrane factor (OMF) lipoprotein